MRVVLIILASAIATIVSPAVAADWPRCRASLATCVVDGDTIRANRERIRLIGVDTPELRPTSVCRVHEKRLAILATERLQALLRLGRVTIEPDGTDRFGRTLARLIVAPPGHPKFDAGERLFAEGYAVQWPHPPNVWCAR